MSERIEVLGRRVRWLDRYRRRLAVGTVALLVPPCLRELTRFLGADWPQAHVTMLVLMAAVIGWWLLEVALAWVAAIWETELDHLVRDRGLPRAIVRRNEKSPP